MTIAVRAGRTGDPYAEACALIMLGFQGALSSEYASLVNELGELRGRPLTEDQRLKTLSTFVAFIYFCVEQDLSDATTQDRDALLARVRLELSKTYMPIGLQGVEGMLNGIRSIFKDLDTEVRRDTPPKLRIAQNTAALMTSHDKYKALDEVAHILFAIGARWRFEAAAALIG